MSCTEIEEATVFNIESYQGTDYEFEKKKDARLGASLGAWGFSVHIWKMEQWELCAPCELRCTAGLQDGVRHSASPAGNAGAVTAFL